MALVRRARAQRLEVHGEATRDREVIPRATGIELAGQTLEARNVVTDFDAPPEPAHHELRATRAVARDVVLRVRVAIIVIVRAPAHAKADERPKRQRARQLLVDACLGVEVVLEYIDVFVRERRLIL